MRAVMLMFDSLNRRFLPPYGSQFTETPNFQRLAAHSVQFDNSYGGSMPCMPARRELHTGRYNFLHRSWGPLEPFDESIPQMLSDAGVYTHLATDHSHYWEDGGATYHNRFRSYEFFRGQEGDPWKGEVADPDEPDSPRRARRPSWRQDLVNRKYFADEADHSQTLTVDAGLEFIGTNHREDSWFLQIECFDPHEPFFSYDEYRKHYPTLNSDGPQTDWPDYKKAVNGDATDRVRAEYAALLTMCDASLGRVLDAFDEHSLWDDTLLIVNTDHGFLLGEHGWWGKNVQPWYDENIHTPLFVWDPASRAAGEHRDQLVQTIDVAVTVLDAFGLQPSPAMQGRSLLPVMREHSTIRDAALFGVFGGHVNVTDGRYVYMRAPRSKNEPLFEHTLMPTHMNSRFAPAELRDAELVPPFSFTDGVPVLRLPAASWTDPTTFGTVLFDLEHDPDQQHPIVDTALEVRLMNALLQLMRDHDAPTSQYVRLGLPVSGPATEEHCLAAEQHARYLLAVEPLPTPDQFPTESGVNAPLSDLLRDERSAEIVKNALGPTIESIAAATRSVTLLDVAEFTPGFTATRIRELHRHLTVDTSANVVV